VSNVTAAQLAEAQRIVPVVSVQNRYSVADREGEDVLEACAGGDIAFMPFFPLGIGRLAGEEGALAAVAQRHGATPAQIALAWLLVRSPVMLPIPGTSSFAHLEENVAAATIRLTPEDITALDAWS
jgi:aryl-alcohol dehydrogenase-like predicted oxidoreductase